MYLSYGNAAISATSIMRIIMIIMIGLVLSTLCGLRSRTLPRVVVGYPVATPLASELLLGLARVLRRLTPCQVLQHGLARCFHLLIHVAWVCLRFCPHTALKRFLRRFVVSFLVTIERILPHSWLPH